MRFRQERQDATIAYAAGASVPYTITPKKDEYILGMLLDFQVPVTLSAPAANQDYLARLITSMSLGSGSNPYIAINGSDARPLYWSARTKLRGAARMTPLPAATGTIPYQLPILFGANPIHWDGSDNYRDTSAGIKRETGLVLSIGFAGATAMGTGITPGAATIGVTLLLAVLEAGDSPPAMRPNWIQEIPTMQSGAGFGMSAPLSTSAIFFRSTIMITNGVSPADNRTDGYSSAAVSQIGVRLSAGNVIRKWQTWDLARISQRGFKVADDNAAVPGASLVTATPSVLADYNPGVAVVDWPNILPTKSINLYGLDMRDAPENDVALVYSVDALANTKIAHLHERYLPQGE